MGKKSGCIRNTLPLLRWGEEVSGGVQKMVTVEAEKSGGGGGEKGAKGGVTEFRGLSTRPFISAGLAGHGEGLNMSGRRGNMKE